MFWGDVTSFSITFYEEKVLNDKLQFWVTKRDQKFVWEIFLNSRSKNKGGIILQFCLKYQSHLSIRCNSFDAVFKWNRLVRWWYFDEIILSKSQYLRQCKIDYLITESIICHIIPNRFQNWTSDCEAQKAIEEEEEGCEEEIRRLKTRKEVRRMYYESILVGCHFR